MSNKIKAMVGLGLMTLGVSTVSQASLISRLGGQAYYDTALDVTWIADANLAASNSFGVAGINASGTMNWGTANNWITAMNAAHYLGFNDWRLPTMLDTGAAGCNESFNGTDCGWNVQTGTAATTVYSELASMFYDTLSNKAYYDTSGSGNQSGWGLNNTGPFANLKTSVYWTGVDYGFGDAWVFYTTADSNNGRQSHRGKAANNYYAWAVRSGDVTSSVPTPGVAWLIASGLLGLLGVSRRRH